MKLKFLYFLVFSVCITAIPLKSISGVTTALSSQNDTATYFTFGGTLTEEFVDMVLTHDSGYAMVGTTNGYGPGNSSIYLVRADKNGGHIWSSVFGGSVLDRGSALVELSGGGFMVAGTSNSFSNSDYDGYLCKTDATGNLIWEKVYGGADWDFFHDVILLPDSTYIVCGESYSYSNGGSDALVMRIDQSGNILWQQHFGDAGDDLFTDALFYDSYIYLTGAFEGTDLDGYLVKIDQSGQLLFEKRFNFFGTDRFNAITVTAASKIIMAGGSIPTDSTNNEFWVQQCDTLGNTGWFLHGIGYENDILNSAFVKSSGDIIVSGMKNPNGLGQNSMFTVQCDSAGGSFRSHSFGGVLDDESYVCIETPQGGLALCGYTSSYGSGGKDACLVLVDTNAILQDYTY
nr:hypothetical protein [Bacteroidia bacterium]